MSVMKIDSLAELRTLQAEMDRLFEHRREETGPEVPDQGNWQPLADIYEDERGVVIAVEVPGVGEEAISLRLEGNTLFVEGERRVERDARHYHRIERPCGAFSRAFALPPHIDREQIRAACEEGVLMIVLPLSEGGADPGSLES